MSFGNAVRTCFRKYVDFSGRAGRSEFWWFVLFVTLVGIVVWVLDNLLGLTYTSVDSTYVISGVDYSQYATSFGWLYTIWALATLLPTLAVGARRLHDRSASGWWQVLLFCCTGIGFLVLTFVWWIRESQPGDNQYGPPPAAPQSS